MFVDTKKSKERTIFDFVYADRRVDSVTPTEEPDFKVKNADGEFGVEITEFYFSQSQARIKNISGYAMEILGGKKYRHKDDIASLAVAEVTVLPGDNRGPEFNVEAIIQEVPKADEYIEKISELIEHKNKRFNRYTMGLSHVNLIIFDYEHRLLGTPKDMFHHLFFQPRLEKALMNADFREVFFVTQLGEFGSPKGVYIPLKMLFLLAEMYFFNHTLVKEYPGTPMTSLLCAEYLTWRGAKSICFKDFSDGYEVVYGNSGVFVSKDNKVYVRDHSDFAIPADFNPVTAQGTSSIFDDAFLRIFEAYKRDSAFSTELGFDASGSDQLARDK